MSNLDETRKWLENVRFSLGTDNNPFFLSILLNLQLLLHEVKEDESLPSYSWVEIDKIHFPATKFSAFGKDSCEPPYTWGIKAGKFLVIHELLHVILGHFLIPRGMNKEICNIAMDAEIHKLMQDPSIGMKKDSVPVECIWPDLYANTITLSEKDVVLIPNITQKGWLEYYHEIMQFLQKKYGKGQKLTDEQISELVKQFNGSGDLGETFDPNNLTSEQRDKLMDSETIIKAAFEKSKGKGNLPAGLEILIESINESKVNWVEELINLVSLQIDKTDIKNRHKSKHAHIRLLSTVIEGHTVDDIVWIHDTSGSMYSKEDFEMCVSEFNGIKNDMNCRIVYMSADHEVYEPKVYEKYEEIDPTELPSFGGGGTSFEPAFRKVVELREKQIISKPSVLVYFTDTYGSFPDKEPDYPVIWLVPVQFKGHHVEVPFGRVIYVD